MSYPEWERRVHRPAGQWWRYDHAKIVLAHIYPGPIAQRRKEQWDETVRNVTRLIGDRVANDLELVRARERSERMERYVEVLESEIEEQDRLRREASQARREHQTAAAAFARGVKASEEATLEQAARHLGAEAVAAAQARFCEQEAARAAEEHARAAEAADSWRAPSSRRLRRRRHSSDSCAMIAMLPGR